VKDEYVCVIQQRLIHKLEIGCRYCAHLESLLKAKKAIYEKCKAYRIAVIIS